MLYVCVGDVMDVVFSVCIVRRGAVCASVWEVCVFCHADVVCVSLVCILWQFSMLVDDARGDHGRGILQIWFHDCIVGSHECHLLLTPSCCGESFYYL